MTRERPSPLAAPGVWALVGAAACASIARLEPNMVEEGFVIEAVQRMLRGHALYRDVVTFTGPLPYELLAALFRIFGEEIAVARGAAVLLHGAATAAAFALARRAGAGAMAHAAGAAVAFAPVLLFPLFSTFYYTTLAFQLGWLAAWAAARGVESPRFAAAAGLLAAGVALCKQTVGGLLALLLVAALALATPPGRRGRSLGALIAGGAAAAAVTLAVFALRGDLGPLLDSLVRLPLSFVESYESPYPHLWPPGDPGGFVRDNRAFYLPAFYALSGPHERPPGTAVYGALQLVYALPFLALLATAARTAVVRPPAAAWIGAALLGAWITNLFPRSDWGHLVYVLPAAAVQGVLLFPASPRPARSRRIAAAASVALLASGSVATAVWLERRAGARTFGPRVPLPAVSQAYRSAAIPRVISYLHDRTRPGEPIFVARAEPLIYFATDTTNPTPYGGVIPGMREKQQRDVLAALPGVRFVVMSEIDQPVFTYYADELPLVQDYLERHFRVPDLFASSPDAWILVLERGPDRGATVLDLIRERERARPFTRDAAGRAVPLPPDSPPLPRLGARHNRRPLPLWLGAGGGGVDYELEIPEDAVLQLDTGLDVLTSPRAAFRHPRDTRLEIALGRDGRFETLWSQPVTPDGRWRPVEIDLAAWAGQRVTLRLELVAESPVMSGRLAWLGSPRIARRPDAEPR